MRENKNKNKNVCGESHNKFPSCQNGEKQEKKCVER
jgi:hypothetical protein